MITKTKMQSRVIGTNCGIQLKRAYRRGVLDQGVHAAEVLRYHHVTKASHQRTIGTSYARALEKAARRGLDHLLMNKVEQQLGPCGAKCGIQWARTGVDTRHSGA